MPILIALLALAGAQAGLPPAAASRPAPVPPTSIQSPAPATPSPDVASPDVADERCLAAFALLASQPGQNDAAVQASRYGTLFFYGKLMGRDPGIDFGAGLRGVAGDVAARMRPEIARCSGEVEAAGHAMAAAGNAARTTPAR